MYQSLVYEVVDSIGVVTLNRPDTANAFTFEMFTEVGTVFEEIEKDDAVKVVVLNSKGKLFSGGGDINMFRQILESKEPLSMELCDSPGRMVLAIRNCSKPVIVAVQGSAAGAGFGVVTACDYRIVGQSTKLVPAFNGIGLSGDSGLLYFLGKNIGPMRALETMTTKRYFDAEEALQLGLVTQVVEDEALSETAFALAKQLLATPLNVFARQKAMINQTLYSNLEEVVRLEAMNTHESSKHPNFFEAVSAFLNKTKPNFK